MRYIKDINFTTQQGHCLISSRTNLDEDVEHGEVLPGVPPDGVLERAVLLGAVGDYPADEPPLDRGGVAHGGAAECLLGAWRGLDNFLLVCPVSRE